MTSPRDITVVIGDMLGVIPESETALRAELLKISNRALFTAPEIMWMRWNECQDILRFALGEPPFAKAWGSEACRIFAGSRR